MKISSVNWHTSNAACLLVVSLLATLFPSSLFLTTASASSLTFEPKIENSQPNIPSTEEAKKSLAKQPIKFEENRGQHNQKVRFVSRSAAQTLFLTNTEAVFSLAKTAKKSVALKMQMIGANPDSALSGVDEQTAKTNIFRGNDSAKWQSNIANFKRVKYTDVYQGVDMLWYGNDSNDVEYDFIVKPTTDYKQIELKFDGAKKLAIDTNGDLLISTAAGILRQKKPATYQETNGERQIIESRFELRGKRQVGFVVGDYDTTKDLTIDPTQLTYGTFLGGSGQDYPEDIAIDAQGNIYVAGTTPSADFPTTSGAFDTTLNGVNKSNGFVTKFNANGGLEYSTFLGGTNGIYGDKGKAIAVDSAGNAYFTGETYASDFPVTTGSYNTVKNGTSNSSAFVTKLNASGSSLVYSTYLGGGSVRIHDIAIDANGIARILGEDCCGTFPVTAGAISTTGDSFYVHLSANGSTLNYSTRIPRTNSYGATKFVIDAGGNSLILGTTSSATFPVTPNAYDTTFNGGDDIFLMKLSSSGSLLYATFLGGSSYDGSGNGMDITLDASGNVYLLAAVGSNDFPRTPGALTRSLSGYDNFMVKFNPQLTSLLISTPIAPNGNIYGYSLNVDSKSNIYIWGYTQSDAFNPVGNCTSSGVFVAKYAPNGTSIKNRFCFNAFANSGSRGVSKLTSDDNIVLMTQTYSSSFTTTANGYNRILNSDDAWIGKVNFVSQGVPFDFDNDQKSDLAVYRGGEWHSMQSTQGYKVNQFGSPTDVPVPADYDGDGKTDFAVWRAGAPNTAAFYILESSTNTARVEVFGQAGDDPGAVGDYDGDGKADPAVYRSGVSGGQSYFYYRASENNPNRNITYIPWGNDGDKPVSGDYNGDGKRDFAVFRPSQSRWYIHWNGYGSYSYSDWFGLPNDKLVPADYDGDGKTDVAVFRPSDQNWYYRQSSNGQVRQIKWGLETDVPVPADYDGDGKTDIATWRNGQWLIFNSSTNSANITQFGVNTDVPIQSVFTH